MTIGLRLLAVVSVLASFICLGLSGMAPDDVSRREQAYFLQLLQFIWFLTSIATPFVAAVIARRNEAAGHRAYVPMVVIGAIALLSLASF